MKFLRKIIRRLAEVTAPRNPEFLYGDQQTVDAEARVRNPGAVPVKIITE